jgi:hypothetical protein
MEMPTREIEIWLLCTHGGKWSHKHSIARVTVLSMILVLNSQASRGKTKRKESTIGVFSSRIKGFIFFLPSFTEGQYQGLLCLRGHGELHDGSDDVSLGLAEGLDGLLAGAVTLGHDQVDILSRELLRVSRSRSTSGLLSQGGGLLRKSRGSAGQTSSGSLESRASLVNLRLSKDDEDLTGGGLEDVGLSDDEESLAEGRKVPQFVQTISVARERDTFRTKNT